MPRPVSLLGLGSMGSALAAAFVKAGYKTTLWNRTSAKARGLVGQGAHLAPSPAAAIEASDLVILCLFDKTVVHKTLQDVPSSSLNGKVIVNLTTETADEARETEKYVRSLAGSSSVQYVQGAIMAVPAMIGLEGCMLLYSGEEPALRAVESDLSVLGSVKFLGPDFGNAPLHDLAILSGMYGLFSGFLHATAMIRAGTGGETTAAEFAALLIPSLTAILQGLGDTAARVDANNFSSDDGGPLDMQLHALDAIIQSSHELDIAPDVLVPLRSLMAKRVEAGGQRDGVASLVGLFKKPA